jgi:hypothetical protein
MPGRLFWLGAAFCVALVLAVFERHAPIATAFEPSFFQDSGIVGAVIFGFERQNGIFDRPACGALTLKPDRTFNGAQHLDLQSRNGISADALFGAAADVLEPPVRTLSRAEHARLTLGSDSASGSSAMVLQN